MDELKRRAAQLDEDVRTLNNTTEANTEALDRIHVRLDRSDKDRRKFITALIALALLAGFLGVETVRLEKAIRDQTEVREEVLCPLYGLILGGYDPDSRSPGPARQRYEDTFRTIREGYGVLSCSAGLLVPPRTN